MLHYLQSTALNDAPVISWCPLSAKGIGLEENESLTVSATDAWSDHMLIEEDIVLDKIH